MLVLVVLKVDDEVGEVMLIVGAVVSGVCGRVTVSTALAELPAWSCATTVICVEPACNPMLPVLQEVVPEAVPLPPRSADQVTWVTPTLSAATPLTTTLVLVVEKVVPKVGAVMVILGAVVSGAV
jgi:hypothetical protein